MCLLVPVKPHTVGSRLSEGLSYTAKFCMGFMIDWSRPSPNPTSQKLDWWEQETRPSLLWFHSFGIPFPGKLAWPRASFLSSSENRTECFLSSIWIYFIASLIVIGLLDVCIYLFYVFICFYYRIVFLYFIMSTDFVKERWNINMIK